MVDKARNIVKNECTQKQDTDIELKGLLMVVGLWGRWK